MSRKRVLVVGGTGYLGQHILQGFFEIRDCPFDLAFTYHSTPPQSLIDAIPFSLAFHVNLRSGEGFDAIAHSFGQVCLGYWKMWHGLKKLGVFNMFSLNEALLGFQKKGQL